MTIELVIFDCDGVLIDSEIISAQMLRAETAERGIDMSMDYIFQNHVGRSFPKVLADIQSQFDIILPAEFEENYRGRLLDAFEKKLKIIPHVRDVIEGLNVPFCVATSSSPKRARRSLELVGLWEMMREVLFTSSEVANGKPAPDLFLHAAKKMKVDPKKCLVIEDSLPGVKAGIAAGMKTIRFTGGGHIIDKTDAAGADTYLENYLHFFEMFPMLKR